MCGNIPFRDKCFKIQINLLFYDKYFEQFHSVDDKRCASQNIRGGYYGILFKYLKLTLLVFNKNFQNYDAYIQ